MTPLTWFVSPADRNFVRVGLDYYIPNLFHQVPRLIREFMEVDVVVTTVSPMDKNGFFTFGTVNDYISTAARCCKTLIVEVNPNMPRVFGDSLLHVSEVDAIVENEVPLLEAAFVEPKPEAETIGRIVAAEVPEGESRWASAAFPTRFADTWAIGKTWAYTANSSAPVFSISSKKVR